MNLDNDTKTFAWPKETSVAIKTRLVFSYRNLCLVKPRYILDVGCGTGELLTCYLAQLFNTAQVIGIDSDERSIQFANKEFSYLPNLKFFKEIPENIRYDAIIASEVMEHVENPLKFLIDLKRHLNDNGVLIVTVPNGYGCSELMALLQTLLILSGVYGILRKAKHTIFKKKSGKPIIDTLAVSPHINFFTLKKIRNVFKDCCLTETRYQGRMFLHNFICSSIIDKSEYLAELNASLGKSLPPPLVSDWMFIIRNNTNQHAPAEMIYKRNRYEKIRRFLNERQLGIQNVP